MGFSSFSVAESVIQDANERFAPLFEPVQKRIDFLRKYCDAFDILIKENDADSFDFEVDEENMTIHIELVFESVECNKDHPQLCQLIKNSTSFSVRHKDGDHISMSFVYPSLWEKAN